jgi:hypothetical protein
MEKYKDKINRLKFSFQTTSNFKDPFTFQLCLCPTLSNKVNKNIENFQLVT